MPGTETVNLTIRSTIKKIDEMTFKCPITWTIYQLKTFVAMTHKQGQDYFKPSKTHFYFGGNPLNDEESLETVLQNKNLKHRYTFIAKFLASLEAEDSNKQSEEEELDKMRILDEHFRLFMDPVQNDRKYTNVGELESLVKLPLMVESIAKQVVKRDAEDNPDLAQQDGVNNNENEELEDMNLERQYIIKLAIRILIVFFLFKSHFHGVLFYIFLLVLAVYCLIKLSQRRVKQRRVVPQNQPRPAGAPNAEARDQNNNLQQQQQHQQPTNVAHQNQPTLANKIKEFVVCFVSSFYPSWDMNLYIENNPVAQQEIAPANPEANTRQENVQNEENTINQNNGEPKPVETEAEKAIPPAADPEQKPEGNIENTSSPEGPM